MRVSFVQIISGTKLGRNSPVSRTQKISAEYPRSLGERNSGKKLACITGDFRLGFFAVGS